MKKGTWIAGAILITLLALYFVLRQKAQTKIKIPNEVISKEVIPAIKNIVRVEISKPNGEFVALEKRDKYWKITKPLDSEIEDFRSKKMDEVFGQKIQLDSLTLSSEKLDSYDLTKEKAFKVSYFSKDTSIPSIEFYVGKESIKNNSSRSFIKTLDGKVFRAKSEISSVIRTPVESLRNRTLFRSNKGVTKVTIRRHSGEKTVLEKQDNKWKLIEPKREINFFQRELSFLDAAFQHLMINNFVDGKSEKDLGLTPPFATIDGEVEGEIVQFEIGHPAPKKYYIRKKGDKRAYEIRKEPGRVLSGDYLAFKDTLARTIVATDIISFRLSNAKKSTLSRKTKEGKWTTQGTKIDQAKIPSLLGSFAMLRGLKWVDKSVTEAYRDLKKPAATFTIKTQDQTHILHIGTIVKKGGIRYAKWASSEYVMEVPRVIWERATLPISKLALK